MTDPHGADTRDPDLAVRVLGPLEVSVGGRPVRLSGRLRAFVAVLAMAGGRPVSVERLGDAVWGQAGLPDDTRRTGQLYVARLRTALGAGSVRTTAAGYSLEIAPDRVDALRFERLVDARAGREQLVRAMDLWRGEPFDGVRSVWLREVEGPRLVERYLDAVERRIGLDLDHGHHGGLVGELRDLTTRHPLRERFWEQLMLALYRSGRQADALDAYRRLYQVLTDEVGVGPGASVSGLHQRILDNDPALDPSVASTVTGPPAQLPADVPAFVGRDAELDLLDAVLADPATGAVAVLSGTAGVGKTALAIRWAHRVRDRFPDGQIYVNLRGYDPEQPMDAGDALARILTALGVTATPIPSALDERAARYRTETAGRRLLIVLDNAASVEQIRPLLPGTASCPVVVTSRDSLAGLVAVHGARRVDLDVLSPAEAHALLRTLIGARMDDEPAAGAALATMCARLPLALRVAAEMVVSRPDRSLRDIAGVLADEQRRLDLLDAGGDPRAAVPAVFSWSVRHLPADTAEVFGLLGLHPGPDFDAHAAAALASTSVAHARRCLDRLVRAHLVRRTAPGRYGMHDLLRVYAAGLARADPGRRRWSTPACGRRPTSAPTAAGPKPTTSARTSPA